jgi:hypothetical protein
MAMKKKPSIRRGIQYAASQYRKGGRKFGNLVKGTVDNIMSKEGYYRKSTTVGEGMKRFGEILNKTRSKNK